MSWSIRLFRVRETEVRLHLTFLLLLLWIGFVHYRQGGGDAAVRGIVYILALFGCVLLHEFGHVLAARRYGIRTPDITLLPIGGVARLQRMPDKPAEELVVALAGPAVNVVIALVLFVVVGGWRSPGAVPIESPTADLATKLLVVNVWLVLFNMIPAFPMDGGRVLRAVLATRMNYARATSIAARTGQLLAFVFGFLGLLYNPFLIFIALFIYIGAAQESAATQMREAARGMTVGDAMVTDFRTLPASATLNDAVELLLRTSQREFPVVADESAGVGGAADGQVQGLLTREDMISALRERGPGAPVADVMHRDVARMPWHVGLDGAMQRINETGCHVVLVTDAAGRLIGMLTSENLGELMLVQAAMSRGNGGAGGGGMPMMPPRREALA